MTGAIGDEPTPDQVRDYLDSHPTVLRDFLRVEARHRSPWLIDFVRKQERISPNSIGRLLR